MGRRADRQLAALGLHTQDVPRRRHQPSRTASSVAVTALLAVILAFGGLYLWQSFAPHAFNTERSDAISRSNRTPVTLRPRSVAPATAAQTRAWGTQEPADLLGRQYLAHVDVKVAPHSDLSPYGIIQNWSLSGPRYPVEAVAPNIDDAAPNLDGCAVTAQALEDALAADGHVDLCLLFSVTGSFDRNQLVYGGFVQHLSGRHGGYANYDARWRLPSQ